MTTENLPVCDVTGKTSYPTRRKARGAALSIKKKYKGTDNASYYECPHCGGWHITSGKPKHSYSRKYKRKNKKGEFQCPARV